MKPGTSSRPPSIYVLAQAFRQSFQSHYWEAKSEVECWDLNHYSYGTLALQMVGSLSDYALKIKGHSNGDTYRGIWVNGMKCFVGTPFMYLSNFMCKPSGEQHLWYEVCLDCGFNCLSLDLFALIQFEIFLIFHKAPVPQPQECESEFLETLWPICCDFAVPVTVINTFCLWVSSRITYLTIIGSTANRKLKQNKKSVSG